eukprot:16429395-Heterocapsa_arctica.AAC.1
MEWRHKGITSKARQRCMEGLEGQRAGQRAQGKTVASGLRQGRQAAHMVVSGKGKTIPSRFKGRVDMVQLMSFTEQTGQPQWLRELYVHINKKDQQNFSGNQMHRSGILKGEKIGTRQEYKRWNRSHRT